MPQRMKGEYTMAKEMPEQRGEPLPDHVEEKRQPYVPRPRWQVIMARILIGIVILGVLNICYWQIFG